MWGLTFARFKIFWLKLAKTRPCKTLILTQKHKSTQKLGTPHVLMFHVQIRVEFFSFHTLIFNPKMFLAYKVITEQKKFYDKVFSYALFLESHRYHNAGEAAWLMEPLDDRVSAYIRKAGRSGCRRPKELQSRVKEFIRNIF